jgi:Fe-S oxidoreductase
MGVGTATLETRSDRITLENLAEFPEGRKVLSCIQCGVCAATCPNGEVLDYSPRRIIAMLGAGLLDEVLTSDDMLSCVMCYACMAKCPRGIRLTEVLLPLVKEQVFLNLAEVPAELQKALWVTGHYGNPLGASPRKRAAWAEGFEVPVRILQTNPEPVDALWFVECYASYHPRGHDLCRATAKVLAALEVDFAILGPEEKSTGEVFRLLGETGLFEKLAEDNMKVLSKYQFKRIITSGVHAYDALVYQYPRFGLDRPVEQMTVFLAGQLDALKPLMTKRLDCTVTYHDSCVLGRHNGFYEEPRSLLQAIPGVTLVEMTHNRVNSICCGGGGGGMWLDSYHSEKGHERLSDRRVREAVATGADVLAVSCPYEVSRFEDAVKVLGFDDRIRVRDVVELVAEAIAS